MGTPVRAEHVTLRPSGALAPLIDRCVGYAYRELEPGAHLGLPSPVLTLVLSLGPPTRVATTVDATDRAHDYDALASGLHLRPARIEYGTELAGIQLDLTPRGARALLGLPASELANAVVGLADVLGPEADELLERLHEAPAWSARFALLQDALTRRARRRAPAPAPLERAWDLILAGGGSARVDDVAHAVGWSARQLRERFAHEYGLSPKELGRVIRFTRSRRLLQDDPRTTLAAAAAACGYYDQSHLAREWRSLAGCPPSRWLADEDLPFVQDDDGRGGPG